MLCNESTAASTRSCKPLWWNTLVIFSDVQREDFLRPPNFSNSTLTETSAGLERPRLKTHFPEIKSAASRLAGELLHFRSVFEERSSLIARPAWKVFFVFLFKVCPAMLVSGVWNDSQSSRTDVSQETPPTTAWSHMILLWKNSQRDAFNFTWLMHKCLFNEQSYFIIYLSPLCLPASFRADVCSWKPHLMAGFSWGRLFSRSGGRRVAAYLIRVTVSHACCHSLPASRCLLHQWNEWEVAVVRWGPRGE